MNDKQIAKMMAFVETCDDPTKLRTIARNAAQKGAHDLQTAAKLKLYAVMPTEDAGTFEYAVWQSIHALEDVLSEERGKTTRLARTRQKIVREGELSCVRSLIKGTPTEGFQMLAVRNMLHLSFEAIALEFRTSFDDDTLEAAEKRLRDAGYIEG